MKSTQKHTIFFSFPFPLLLRLSLHIEALYAGKPDRQT